MSETHYDIGYDGRIYLHGASGDVWPIDLEEAEKRLEQLEDCIERRKEALDE